MPRLSVQRVAELYDMGLFDGLTTPDETTNTASSGGVFSSVGTTAPTVSQSTGGIFDSVKAPVSDGTSPAPVVTPPTTSPYFQGTEKSGTFIGISDQSDPFSGRPFLAYKEPGEATTTDTTRVASKMNPEIAAPTLKTDFENPRMPESASQAVRAADGATSDEQLDHRMALAVGGSNDTSNLKVIPTADNQAASSDEEKMAGEVAAGTMSLFQAQAQEAQNKGLPAPFTDTAKKASILSNIANSPAGTLLAKIRDSILGFGAKPSTDTTNKTPLPTVSSMVGSTGQQNPQGLQNLTVAGSRLDAIIKNLGPEGDALKAAKADLDATKVDDTNQASVDAYNKKVDAFNAQLQTYDFKGAQAQKIVKGFGDAVDAYNKSVIAPSGAVGMLSGIVDGFVKQYTQPSPLEQSMEQNMSLHEDGKTFPQSPLVIGAMRTVEPALEPLITDIGSSIIFNTPDLYAHFVNNIAKNGVNSFSQNAIDATEKSPLQVVGDTAQAVLMAYMPEFFGEGMSGFAEKGVVQNLLAMGAHGAAAGATFGVAQAASSGSTDPKELAAIVLQNTVAGTLLSAISGGVAQGAFKAPEILDSIKERLPQNLQQAQRGFVKIPGMAGGEDITPEDQQKPTTPEDASTRYREQVLEPQAAEGKPVVIGADDMKDYFGGDYDIANHPTYSKAAYDLVPEMAAKNDEPRVIYTAGGPGSGKSELIKKEAGEGFSGVISDSNLSNYEGAKAQMDQLRAMGKQPEIHMILTSPEEAYHHTKVREAEGGHPISDAPFIKNHAANGSPAAVLKLVKEDNIPLKLIDTRGQDYSKNIQEMEYEKDPIATLEKVGYTKEQLQGIVGDYGKTPEQQETLARIQKRSVSSQGEARSHKGQKNNDEGGSKQVLRSEGRVNTKLEKMAENSHSFKEFVRRAGVGIETLEATAKAKGYKNAEDFYNKNKKLSTLEDILNSHNKVYRSSEQPYNPSLMKEDGTYVSDSPHIAGFFAGGREVEELYLKPDAKILRWEDLPQNLKDNLMDPEGDLEPEQIKIAQYARSKGFDAVAAEPGPIDGTRTEVQVVNPDVLKSKQDIETEYKKNNPPIRNVEELKREIEELKPYVEYHDEYLKDHPAKSLQKYYGNQNPRYENLDDIFARNVDRRTGAKSAGLDDRVTHLGYETPAAAHEGVLQYLDAKDQNAALHEKLKTLQQELKDSTVHAKAVSKDQDAIDKIGREGETSRRSDESAFARQKALAAAKEQEQLKGYTRPVIVDKNGKDRFGVDPLANPSNFYQRMGEIQKADPDRSLNELTHISREDIGGAIERQKNLETARTAKQKAIEKSSAELPRRLSFREKLRGTLKPISSLPDDVRPIAEKWQGDLLEAAELANRERGELPDAQTKIEKNGTRTIIKKSPLDKKLPPDEAVQFYTAIQHGKFSPLRAVFDRLYSYATRKGLDIPYRTDYLPQVYKEPLGDIKVAVLNYMKDYGVDEDTAEAYVQGVMHLPTDVSNRLKIHPSFEEAKAFPTYSVAAKYGLHPKFTNPADLAVNYRYELEKSIANKNFVSSLIDKGKMLPNDLAPQHWEHVTTNFVKGDLYAPPELARMLNGLYKDEANMGIFDTAVHYLGLASRKAQEIALSGAIPYTNIHFFSIGQLIKEFTAGNFKAAGPFIRANSLEATAKWFQKNQMYSDMMARQGIDISSRMGSIKQIYNSLSHDSTWMDKIGIQFRKAFLDKSFGTFLPALYTQVFKDTYNSALGKGMEAAAAEEFAGNVTKTNFGLLGSEARAQATDDTLSGIFFAPVFRESVFGVLSNAMKSVSTEIKNPEFYRSRRLVAGMVLSFGMYQVFNKMMNGSFTWQNPNGHEFDLRVPLPGGENMYVPFMPSFLALPRAAATAVISTAKGDFPTAEQQASNVFALPLQVAVQVLANKDYFGSAIYKATDSGIAKTGKIAAYIGLSVSHPYIKAVVDMVTKKQPLYQTLSEAATLPFKFQTDTAISQGAFYTALTASANKNAQASSAIAPIYEQVQQLVAAGKTDQASAIVDGLTDAQYKEYVAYKKTQTASATTKNESGQYAQYQQIQALINQGKTSQAQAILDGMTDAQYHAYTLLKSRFAGQ